MFKMDALSKWIKTPEADKIPETRRKKAEDFSSKIPKL